MTETVKRFNMGVGKFGNVDAYESEHGRWVKRDDYARLEQECERLRELAEQANVNCRNTAYYLSKYRPDLSHICSGWCDAICTAMSAKP